MSPKVPKFLAVQNMGWNRNSNVWCFGSVSKHEKEIFVKGGFSKNSLSIAVVMCKAAIPTL